MITRRHGEICNEPVCAGFGRPAPMACSCVGGVVNPKPLTRVVKVQVGPFSFKVCAACGMDVDPACGCLNGRAAARRDAIMKSVSDCIRIANKPRARIIKAYSQLSAPGPWPTQDTWVVRKTLNGRIVRGYGYTLEGAIADFQSMYALALRASVIYKGSW